VIKNPKSRDFAFSLICEVAAIGWSLMPELALLRTPSESVGGCARWLEQGTGVPAQAKYLSE